MSALLFLLLLSVSFSFICAPPSHPTLADTARGPRRDYPLPLDVEVERSPSSVVSAIQHASSGEGPFLYRAEGLTFAYIKRASPSDGSGTLFVDGQSFRLGSHMVLAAAIICSKARITPGDLKNHLSGSHAGDFAQLLQKLLLAGYLYASDG